MLASFMSIYNLNILQFINHSYKIKTYLCTLTHKSLRANKLRLLIVRGKVGDMY